MCCLSTQLFNQRQDLLVQRVPVDGSNLLEPNDAVFVNQVGFRSAVNTVINGDTALEIRDAQHIRISKLSEPGDRILSRVLPIKTVDWYRAGSRKLNEQRMLWLEIIIVIFFAIDLVILLWVRR